MRKILVAIVALMTSLSAFAADMDLFLKGAVSISKFNLDDSENRMGAAAGFGSRFHISNSRFFISLEAMYAQKGQENEVAISNGYKVIPALYHMIEVPVMFGGQFDLPVKDMYLTAGVGPYISYDFRLSENDQTGIKFLDSGTKLKGLSHGDLGVAFTLGVHYKRLFLFYDYDLGLRDITQGYYPIDERISHRSMRIGAGYTFPTLTIGKQRKKPQM